MNISQRYYAAAEGGRGHGRGLAIMALLAVQGIIWFGIGFVVGLTW